MGLLNQVLGDGSRRRQVNKPMRGEKALTERLFLERDTATSAPVQPS